MKEKIIAQGVKNLHEFGYPHANSENIMTDMIYKEFFRSMIKDTLYTPNLPEEMTDTLNDLLNQL